MSLCPRCRRRLRAPESGADDRPPTCERLVALWRYEPPITRVIAALKYRRLTYLGEHLGDALAEAFPDLGDLGEDGASGALVTSVPLHWRRRLTRGFDHAAAIARPLARRLGLRYAPLLTRRRATRPQVGMVRAARLENPRGAFAVRRAARPVLDELGDRPVLLVDDVATTGATLDAAAGALVAAGAARPIAVVVAHAGNDGGHCGMGSPPRKV